MEPQTECPSCKRQTPIDKFCVYCGASLRESTERVAEMPAPNIESSASTISGVASPTKTEVKVTPFETIVNKARFDFPTARTMAEEKKLSFFTSLGFLKPKLEEVVCNSFAAGYEVFVRIRGTYHINYYRKNSYRIPVDEQVIEAIVLDQTLTPVTPKGKTEGKRISTATVTEFLGIGTDKKPTKEILLGSDERIIKDISADILHDATGNEVNQPQTTSSEPDPEGQDILKRGVNLEELVQPAEALVERFKSRIFQRPSEAARIVEENLDVTQVSIIYNPFYHVTYVNKKSNDTKQLNIDGVTGEISILLKTSKLVTLCPKCGRKITLEEKYCEECGTKLLP